MQHTPSRFLKVAAAQPEGASSGPVSRFLVQHPKVSRFIAAHPALSRFVAQLPGVSRFTVLPVVAPVEHIAPVYNTRARKPRRPSLKM
jgi:hypothetical protein